MPSAAASATSAVTPPVQLVTGHPRQFVAQQAEQCHHAGTVVRHTRRASRSADTRLALKKRKYRFSVDIASCSRLTAS